MNEQDPECLALSAPAECVLRDLLSHWRRTSKNGKGRLFRLCESDYDYAEELGLTDDELESAFSELYQDGIGYCIRPHPSTRGQWKFALYADYVSKSASADTTTTTLKERDTGTSAGFKSTPAQGEPTTPPVSAPLSHPEGTPLEAPRYLPDLNVYTPGRLHRVVLHSQVTLDPQRTFVLREAADRGRASAGNNRFGTMLRLSKYQISPRGRLRLFITDPERITEAVEEFAAFCDSLHLSLNGVLEGTAECDTGVEVGYGVSGNVSKYSKCRVWVEVRGYRAMIFFDRSPGDYELEVHARGKGQPEAIRGFTDMIVVNGAIAAVLKELPARTAEEVVEKLLNDTRKRSTAGREPQK